MRPRGLSGAASLPVACVRRRCSWFGVRGAISTCAYHAPFRAAADDRSSARCRSGSRATSPTQIEQAYDMDPLYHVGLTGAGKTIVIVDSFGSPTIRSDLATFDSDLRPAGTAVVQDHRASRSDTAVRPERSQRSPAGQIETSLDVEYSHAMAPGANILLVETPVAETEGIDGLPADRRGRELRDQPPSRRCHQPELRRHRGDVPQRRSQLYSLSAAPTINACGTT